MIMINNIQNISFFLRIFIKEFWTGEFPRPILRPIFHRVDLILEFLVGHKSFSIWHEIFENLIFFEFRWFLLPVRKNHWPIYTEFLVIFSDLDYRATIQRPILRPIFHRVDLILEFLVGHKSFSIWHEIFENLIFF